MSIGEHLGFQGATPADVKIKTHLNSQKAGPWLLIIDSADDMNMWITPDGSSLELKTCIPLN